MRRFAAALLTLAVAAAATTAAQAAPPELAGRWKLMALPFGNDEFLIFDVKDGVAEVVSTQTMLGDRKAEVKAEGGTVTVDFPGKGVALSFKGKVADNGKVIGTITYASTTYPARLEKTDAGKVAPLSGAEARAKLTEALRLGDPKGKAAKLADVIKEYGGEPYAATAYAALLGVAEPAGLTEEQVRKLVEDWSAEAAPYGDAWVADVRSRALKALQGKKTYGALATELALAAEKALPEDAPLEARASVVGMLAASARLAGKADLAEATEAKVKAFESKLDEEYHKTVPPFKPAAFEGRKGGKGGRTVVMEIFTGAECPPCVGADVGFDALLKTYEPTEFIGLQYHLHIPGPDPLTNDDSVARQKYYGAEVRGTPSTFFDGKRDGGSGGGMAQAEAKYNVYRGLVDPALETPKKAEVTVTASRTGDELKIEASAEAVGPVAEGARPRLRLVLVEESVKYTGGNKLRFHHNVVRAFPGGVEGKALEGGKGSVSLTVKLEDVRKAQQEYLERFPSESGRSFPRPLPPVELDDLAVVALVQDDADHAIWQGVQVPVRVVNP